MFCRNYSAMLRVLGDISSSDFIYELKRHSKLPKVIDSGTTGWTQNYTEKKSDSSEQISSIARSLKSEG